jgi:hypothetical protein
LRTDEERKILLNRPAVKNDLETTMLRTTTAEWKRKLDIACG